MLWQTGRLDVAPDDDIDGIVDKIVLWQTGRLDVAPDDDIDGIVDKIGRYLRLRRNPLLDRKDFFGCNQEEGENIDQYVASLVRIDYRCAYEDDIQTCCTQCGHTGPGTTAVASKSVRIRDRLIFGLCDPGMQQRVLLEDFGQNLTLDRVLQICKVHESSTDIGLALAQQSPAHLLAARRSAYKKATSESPAPSPRGYCGDGCHPRTQCKARKHFCGHCGKPGHFATACRCNKPPWVTFTCTRQVRSGTTWSASQWRSTTHGQQFQTSGWV